MKSLADRKDKQRLDWLEKQNIAAPGLINDDFGRWAVAFDGQQQVMKGKGPWNMVTTYFARKPSWKKTVRAAIDYAIKNKLSP